MARSEFYMKFYHREWLSSSTIAMMSASDKGIYIQLLCHQFEDGELPNDDEALRRLAGCDKEEFDRFKVNLDKCFPIVGNIRRNSKVHDIREETQKKRKKNKENGRKGGRPTPPEDGRKTSKNMDNQTVNQTVSKKKPNGSIRKSKELSKEDTSVSPLLPPLPPEGDGALLVSEPIAAWWEVSEGDAAKIARAIASVKMAGGKQPYGPNQLPRDAVEKLTERIRKIAPDQETIDSFFDAFAEYHEGKRKGEYTNPVRAINDWLNKREPEWLKLRKARVAEVGSKPKTNEDVYNSAMEALGGSA